MPAIEVQHFLGRARDFLDGMKLLSDDLTEYRYSSALLAIHSAISYCDALRSGLGGVKLSLDNHLSAVGELRTLLADRKYDKPQGADRLERLLSKKSKIAYAADEATKNEIDDIVLQAERFALWAEEVGEKLKIEGW
jgi:hypothetical protein